MLDSGMELCYNGTVYWEKMGYYNKTVIIMTPYRLELKE